MPTSRAHAVQTRADLENYRRALDELLYEEISRRRQDPDLAERTDVFSTLLLAEDQDGQRMSDQEVRDELITLVLAGHETSAISLAWTFDLLLHSPAVLERASKGDDEYLDAVVKEALRIRPVIPQVARMVRGGPFRLGDYEIPEGVQIHVPIRAIHRRADLYPEPHEFRPERFLGENPPDTYTWIPFGGGTRRCPGASFALMEMRLVVRRILERATLRAASPSMDEPILSLVTLPPRNGVRVVQDQAPVPVDQVEGAAAVN
jgi:cytochrome P450